MNTNLAILLITSAAAMGGAQAFAAEHVVDQKDKQFSVSHLSVRVGDKVAFKNADAYFHNVFSVSEAKTFDLGSYAQGKAKSVTFDKEGEVEIECAIHPKMKMVVEVTK